MGKIITYGGCFEAFMEMLTSGQRLKINYGMLLLKSIDRLPMKFVKYIASINMQGHENDNQIRDYDLVPDREFGAPGSAKRLRAEDAAHAFYSGQIIKDVRRREKVTQAELASRIGSTKSYISKIEKGSMTPSVSTFYRIIHALGLRIDITQPCP